MEIIKTLSLFSDAKLSKDGEETIVAHFSASISNQKLTHNINVTITDKELIELNEANKQSYEEQYNLFVQTVHENLL